MNTKQWRGWTLPESEQHLTEWMATVGDVRAGRPVYQGHKYDAAMSFVRRRRLALDVGANIGLWSWLMARDFDQVHAFEPVADYAACWRCNVEGQRVHLHEVALGDKPGRASLVCRTGGSCGDTTIDVGQGGQLVGQDVEVRTLDSYRFNEVDLIKCDNEGYEVFVMHGGAETIERCRPVVIVEQKPGHGKAFGISDTAAVKFLRKLGMSVQREISGDYILTF
jgi:FkbM family methyltransferase